MIGLGLGLVRQAVRNASGQAWTPAQLFASGEQGVWYEPKPEYLYQDAAGTTPVTADGDPVGLMLDRSQGLVLGPELVTNGGFDTGSDWITESNWSISEGVATTTAENSGARELQQPGVMEVGTVYQIAFDIINIQPRTGGTVVRLNDSSSGPDIAVLAAGDEAPIKASAIIKATQSQLVITTSAGSAGQEPFALDNISVRELPGNHATQSTSAARPTYRTDGVLHWLEFDGVDDFLQSGLLTLTDKWFVSWSGAFSAYAKLHGPWRMLSEGGSPTSSTSNRLEEYTRDTPDRAIFSRVSAEGGVSDRKGVWPTPNTPVVGWANRNPPVESKVGEIFTGSQTPKLDDDLPYSEGTASLSIFRGYQGDFMPGRLYGYVFTVGGASSENRGRANDHLASLAGVTL